MNNLSKPPKYDLSEEQHRKIAEGREMLASPIASEETMIWHGRRSWIPTVIGILVSIGFGAGWLWLNEQLRSPRSLPEVIEPFLELLIQQGVESADAIRWLGYIFYGFAALCLVGVVKKIIRQLRTTYTVTSQRVIVKRGGILRVTGAQIELYQVKDFMYARGALGSLLGYATITLISSGRVMPVLKLEDVTDAARKVDAIRRASQLAKAETGRVSISE